MKITKPSTLTGFNRPRKLLYLFFMVFFGGAQMLPDYTLDNHGKLLAFPIKHK